MLFSQCVRAATLRGLLPHCEPARAPGSFYLVVRVIRDHSDIYIKRHTILNQGYKDRGGPHFNCSRCVEGVRRGQRMQGTA